MSFSVHINNKERDILTLCEGPTQGLDNTTLTVEKKYSINFTASERKFCLSLHYNGANSHLLVNSTEIIKFKVKDSTFLATPLCLGKISEDFTAMNMRKAGLYGYTYDCSVDYDATAVDEILDVHKYLIQKNGIVHLDLVKVFVVAMTFFSCNALEPIINQECKIIQQVVNNNSNNPFFILTVLN